MKEPVSPSRTKAQAARPAPGARYGHVNREITDAVTASNTKVVADAPAMAMGAVYQSLAHAQGLMFENAVTAQQQQALLAEAATNVGLALLYRSAGLSPPDGAVTKPADGGA